MLIKNIMPAKVNIHNNFSYRHDLLSELHANMRHLHERAIKSDNFSSHYQDIYLFMQVYVAY